MASLLPKQGQLGKRLANHLLRRATFNVSKKRVDDFAQKTATQAVTELLKTTPPTIAEPIDFRTGQAWINSGVAPTSQGAELRYYVNSWWLEAARQDLSIGHKMQFWLHTNFTADNLQRQPANYFDHLALFQFYQLGNFKSLARKITFDNVMLAYLNGAENVNGKPNENYAREFLELFTIGKGAQRGLDDYTNYTEEDVRAAAKLLSGMTYGDRKLVIDPDTNLPTGKWNINAHDKTDKTFSDAFQKTVIKGGKTLVDMNAEFDNFLTMIFSQAETPRAVVRRIYRFFVGKKLTPEIEKDIIQPLADTFSKSGFELKPVIEMLLSSQHFFDADDANAKDEVLGTLIKSPMDLFLLAMNQFELPVPDPVTAPEAHYFNFYWRSAQAGFTEKANMKIFNPISVAGYPAYHQEPDFNRGWFNASTIVPRYRLGDMLLQNKRLVGGAGAFGVQLDPVTWVKKSFPNVADSETLVAEILALLLPEPPENKRFSYFLNTVFLNNLPAADWTYEWAAYLKSGKDTEVKIPLQKLIRAIMVSPEYQLF
jgi:uncharacterized protein (DUF1800 family)